MAAFDRFPVRMRPVILQKIWGGPALRDLLGKADGAGAAGESWEVSALSGFESVVQDGPAAGWVLSRYVDAMGASFYGGPAPPDGFPLLVKFLGPSAWLSVQVHPKSNAGKKGKSEAWLIVSAPEGAVLACGVACGRKDFEKALRAGSVRECLRWLPVKAGDVVNIPAGTVHALGPDILAYEIQQSSDTTYRVYDWDRLDPESGRLRDLHVAQSLESIAWDEAFPGTPGLALTESGAIRTVYVCNRSFALERVDICGRFEDRGPDGFSAWSVIRGSCRVICPDPERCFDAGPGLSFLVPACALGIVFEGEATLLKGHACPPAVMRRYLAQRGADENETKAIDWR